MMRVKIIDEKREKEILELKRMHEERIRKFPLKKIENIIFGLNPFEYEFVLLLSKEFGYNKISDYFLNHIRIMFEDYPELYNKAKKKVAKKYVK